MICFGIYIKNIEDIEDVVDILWILMDFCRKEVIL